MNGFQLPNTTPVPNEIINGWAMKLKGSELKVLLLVVRKTLGWILDPETGMRKEEDWISYSQLKETTGLASESLSAAIDALCSKYSLIQIRDKDGNSLDTSEKRGLAGRRRLSLYYRLNMVTLKQTSHYFENRNSDLQSENRNSTTSKIETALLRKSKTTKSTITKSTITKESMHTPYSQIDDLSDKEFQEISDKYQVPIAFVRSKHDDMILWAGEKPNNPKLKGRNWKLTLMNWVKRDSLKIRKEAQSVGSKAGIDARHLPGING